MLPAMCSHPPCMNIEVRIVRKAGGCWRSSTGTGCELAATASYSGVPSHRRLSCPGTAWNCPGATSVIPTFARSHSLPGWVIRYGIAPYSTTVFVSTLSPPDNENDGPWRNRNTSTLITMNVSVTTGKRSEGMLSRRGIKVREA